MLLFATTLLALSTQAQEATSLEKRAYAPERKQETGMFVESKFFSDNSSYFTQVGLSYKRWIKPNMGLRFSLGWMEYTTDGPWDSYSNLYSSQNDTLTFFSNQQNMQYAVVSGGVEFQRAFYRRFYLYAGGDLRLGYGAGYNDKFETHVYNSPQQGYYQSTNATTRYDLRNFMAGISPFIGAKYNGKRWVIGLELVQLSTLQIVHEEQYDATTSNLDMDWGYTRLYVNFRF